MTQCNVQIFASYEDAMIELGMALMNEASGFGVTMREDGRLMNLPTEMEDAEEVTDFVETFGFRDANGELMILYVNGNEVKYQ